MALPSLLELVEEILVRVPPDEPAYLIRAALVCKAWRSIISNDTFLRRYRRFHGTPPLLGYIHNVGFNTGPRFVPTVSNFSLPPSPSSVNYSWALDSRHGRVLIYAHAQQQSFIVWDPITCSKQHLSVPIYPSPNLLCSWAGAVLCAVEGCDHLNCHGCPFIVIFVGAEADDEDREHITCTWASIYSSATGAWSTRPTSSINNSRDKIAEKPTLLIGQALYFSLQRDASILKYDLSRHELSLIDTPEVFDEPVPIEAIDGGLGFVVFSRNCIDMWSRQADANGIISSWTRHRVVELDTLIPIRHRSYLYGYPCNAIRFVEGTNTILISIYNTDNGVFTLDLESRHIRKIANRWDYPVLPYMSFYTPDLAAKGSQLSPP